MRNIFFLHLAMSMVEIKPKFETRDKRQRRQRLGSSLC